MTQPRLALVVDDERDIRELLSLTLGRMGLKVETASDVTSAKTQLMNHSFDLCITDMRLPDGNGLDLVSYMSERYPTIPVAMITAHGNVDAAVTALKAGAFDFVSKPVDLSVLRRLVTHALELNTKRREAADSATKLIGNSPIIQKLRSTIDKIARNQAPVLIYGESGAGKEMVARMIHEQSARQDGPFVLVNCGAIPPAELEPEFFGYKKGGFSGASSDKPSVFELADGGTLFLDEITELPLQMQVKLLRVIQEKSVRSIGSSEDHTVDVRIISSTDKNLTRLVEEGRFRHDLYYRINVIELPVPPLRECREDIVAIARSILSKISSELDQPAPPLDSEAEAALMDYPFPGNLPELENILERAVALCEGMQITVADLHLPRLSTLHAERGSGGQNHAGAAQRSANGQDNAIDFRRVTTETGLPEALEQIEREAITKALEANRWNKTKTAAALGITFRALRYKLKKLGLE